MSESDEARQRLRDGVENGCGETRFDADLKAHDKALIYEAWEGGRQYERWLRGTQKWAEGIAVNEYLHQKGLTDEK